MSVPCVIAGPACPIVGGATKSLVDSGFGAVVASFEQGVGQVMQTLSTFWLHGPSPDVSTASGSVLARLDGLTAPLVAFAAVAGLLAGGVRLAWAGHRGGEAGRSIMRGLLLMVVVTGAGASVVELLLRAFDGLATYVVTTGLGGTSAGVGARLGQLGTAGAGQGSAVLFLLALLAIVASFVQLVLLTIRGAVLVLLVGVLPVAAAASVSELGYGWFKRLCGWIFSFVAYKLAAALIYAAAFALIGTGKDLASVISGFGLIVMAVLALPALLRLIPPATEAIGGSGGGGLLAAAGAAATGAVALAGKGTGSGSAGPPATASPGLTDNPGPSGAGPTSDGRAAAPVPPGGGGSPGSPAAASGAGAAGKGAAGSAGPAAAVAAGVQAGQAVAAAGKDELAGVAGEGPGR